MASKKLDIDQHALLDMMLAQGMNTADILDTFLEEHGISLSAPAISWHRSHCHERIAAAILVINRVKVRRARDRAAKQRIRAGIPHKHCVTCTCY